MKSQKILLLFTSILLFTSCGISKKASETHKYENKTEVISNDSTKILKETNTKKDSLSINIKEITEADSVIIINKETILPDGTISTEKIVKVHKPKKETNVDLNNTKNEHSSKIDSAIINKLDSTSHVKQQDKESAKTSIGVPFYFYILGIGIILIIIFNKKWGLGKSLMGILKKFWGLIKP